MSTASARAGADPGIDSGRRPDTPGPGDGLVRLGAILFAIGTVATLATVTPLLIGADALPRTVYLVALLMPAGFALALAGLLRTARSQRRR